MKHFFLVTIGYKIEFNFPHFPVKGLGRQDANREKNFVEMLTLVEQIKGCEASIGDLANPLKEKLKFRD